ncbi:ribbon-helix-helix domain-containing protein [Acidithiobacillus sp. IBUN Pt1247-S3]|uniref:ribbon-helix-helix domain-containing protein n=1 Tax=Acidithiobacillus sp. IBUN Pt1247-S3 TaxID=3166642 RepID=UPI0034E4EB2C
MEKPVRWTITASPACDIALRTYLGAQGMRKGDLSRFVEEAVMWRIFDRSVQSIKDRNADLDGPALQAAIDAEWMAVRRSSCD